MFGTGALRHWIALGACWILAASVGCNSGSSGGGNPAAAKIGDQPTVADHFDQLAIENGEIDLESILAHGRLMFEARFNELDGAGRPETTGTGGPRMRRDIPDNFNRISANDANACVSCHNGPRSGGGGDNVANVFVMAQRFPFVNFDGGEGDGFEDHTLLEVGNERNTLGMFGAGFVELLAREMTADLHAIRDAALDEAFMTGLQVVSALETKGVSFGSITAFPDGTLDTTAIDGVDDDLVIKPFHQKGAVISLRQFTNNAMNHHHGMQPVERFGEGVDADNDGVVDELTVGDITAATIWQAMLPVPGRVLPNDMDARDAVANGEQLFSSIGCAECHIPALRLESPVFTEPNPYNPDGNLRPEDVGTLFSVDLTAQGPGPHLARQADGSVLVPLFSDLKRHDMGPELDNEHLEQDGIPTAHWLTRKLWGAANEPPYLHHGRALLLSEAIEKHGGDAQASRDAFVALDPLDQGDIVEFLKTLQVLPPDAESLTIFENGSGIIGDEPAVQRHIRQSDVDQGLVGFHELEQQGQRLFDASFNTLDGAGRPETTGTGAVRARRDFPQNFNRVSAPDANACGGCHNLPRSGGGGDNVANVFVLGQRFPFVNFDGGEGDGFEMHTLKEVANERVTLGMFGSGYIELLAREMTADLHAIRDAAIAEAQQTGNPVTRALLTKGVSFGSLTAHLDGTVDTSGIEGIDADLIVKPFHQKGVVISLRQFSNNAMNHHHGMQPSERFGAGVDFDVDGYADELTEGDMTAVTIFQAALPVPGRVMPEHPAAKRAVERGEELFSEIGCATCHIPNLRLESPIFTEPNPYNPPGNLQVGDVPQPFAFDLTTDGPQPRLPREADGSVLVPAFTDLKRHDMGPDLNNEMLEQDGIATEQWLTKKLWGMANEPPFMHHGRCLLISDAIMLHGGEGQESRDNFVALSPRDQDAIVEFLKTLQVLEPGESRLVVEADE